MLPDSWQNVQRVLMIKLGSSEEVLLTVPAMQKLRESLPNTTITLMTSSAGSQVALQLPWVDECIAYEGADFTSLNTEREIALIKKLQHKAFDAAVIFTKAKESPYPLAYICYLAGIPIRLGQSQEFGGSVLSQCVKPEGSNNSPLNQHLFLLESAGFPQA